MRPLEARGKKVGTKAACPIKYEATSLSGYRGDKAARELRISGRGVSDYRERGKKIILCRLPCLSRRSVRSYWG